LQHQPLVSFTRHPISLYMTTPVETASVDTPLADAAHLLAARRISAVPVIDARGSIVGVVSRWDLLHHQRRHPHAHDATCATIMTQGPIVIGPGAPIGEAAQLMIDHRIHRVFVVDEGRLTGVITTTDLARAVEDARVARPLHEVMTSPVVTIDVEKHLALANEWLDRAHVTGLVVTERDWPIGVFTQEDALAMRDLPPTTPLDSVYDPSLICLPRATSLGRAAAQCARMGVRRIVVTHQHDFVGVVSGLDFAAAVVAGTTA
jgi:predicted transcriptional regulator